MFKQCNKCNDNIQRTISDMSEHYARKHASFCPYCKGRKSECDDMDYNCFIKHRSTHSNFIHAIRAYREFVNDMPSLRISVRNHIIWLLTDGKNLDDETEWNLIEKIDSTMQQNKFMIPEGETYSANEVQILSNQLKQNIEIWSQNLSNLFPKYKSKVVWILLDHVRAAKFKH
jgi:hypothetical protein